MIILFKFHKDNIKTLDLDDNYTFKKISIKLNKLGYCDKNVKFIYLGNILNESQKISELVGITNNSYISVIQCKERLSSNYLMNLCTIFTGLYNSNTQLLNLTNSNTDILNENFNNQLLDNTVSIEDSDNSSIQEIENNIDNSSENNSSDNNSSENNSSDNNSSENNSSDNNSSDNNSSDNNSSENNSSENNSSDNENDLLEIDITTNNNENISNIQENLTNQIENIIDNSLNNFMSGIGENNIQLLVDMGYLDQNLNQMALDLNHNNINLAIEWMEQFR